MVSELYQGCGGDRARTPLPCAFWDGNGGMWMPAVTKGPPIPSTGLGPNLHPESGGLWSGKEYWWLKGRGPQSVWHQGWVS